MTKLDALIAARELIADPVRWTQGLYAKNAEGFGCDPLSPDAVCWCGEGATIKVAGSWKAKVLGPMWRALAAAMGRPESGGALININDSEGHAAVLAAFDRAIRGRSPMQCNAASYNYRRCYRKATYTDGRYAYCTQHAKEVPTPLSKGTARIRADLRPLTAKERTNA